MNKKETIKKIQLLKKIQPKQSTLTAVKNSIYSRVGIDQQEKEGIFRPGTSSFARSYRFIAAGVIFALFLLIFSLTISSLLPEKIHALLLYGRVAFASSQYDKANIALTDLTNYESINHSGRNDLSHLSQNLAFANEEMSALKLKGEKGKYTALQCHQLYQQYLNYLKAKNASFPAGQQSFSTIKTQITAYEEQAEQKLQRYPRL